MYLNWWATRLQKVRMGDSFSESYTLPIWKVDTETLESGLNMWQEGVKQEEPGSGTRSKVLCLLWIVSSFFTPSHTSRSYVTPNWWILHIFHMSITISCSSFPLIAICEGKVGSFNIKTLWLFPLLLINMPTFDSF